MDEKTEKNLWEELKLLQPIIDKFDKVSLQVKAWFITAFTAVAGFSMTGKQQKLLCRNFVLILLFYFAEAPIVQHTTHFSKEIEKSNYCCVVIDLLKNRSRHLILINISNPV
jgi:hypothetical protein